MSATARLPSHLKRRAKQMELVQENLARLKNGEAPIPLPEPSAPEIVVAASQQVVAQEPEFVPEPVLAPEPAAETAALLARLAALEEQRRVDQERFQQTLQAAQSETSTLRSQISQREQEQEAQRVSNLSRDDLLKLFSVEQLERFGEEECRLLAATSYIVSGQVIKSEVQRQLATATQDLNRQRAQLDQLTEQTYFQALAKDVPNWQQINKDQRWLAWLSETDPIAGEIRDRILQRRRSALDATGTINLFKAFLSTQQPTGASSRVLPNGRPPAVPPTTAALANQGTVEPITRAFIREETAKFSRGEYRRDPAKWADIQRRIGAAAAARQIV